MHVFWGELAKGADGKQVVLNDRSVGAWSPWKMEDGSSEEQVARKGLRVMRSLGRVEAFFREQRGDEKSVHPLDHTCTLAISHAESDCSGRCLMR